MYGPGESLRTSCTYFEKQLRLYQQLVVKSYHLNICFYLYSLKRYLLGNYSMTGRVLEDRSEQSSQPRKRTVKK